MVAAGLLRGQWGLRYSQRLVPEYKRCGSLWQRLTRAVPGLDRFGTSEGSAFLVCGQAGRVSSKTDYFVKYSIGGFKLRHQRQLNILFHSSANNRYCVGLCIESRITARYVVSNNSIKMFRLEFLFRVYEEVLSFRRKPKNQ